MNTNAELIDLVTSTATQHQEETISLLQDLIRIPSVNPYFSNYEEPSREGHVQDIFATRLDRLGATLDRWEPSAADLAKHAGGPTGHATRRAASGRRRAPRPSSRWR